MAIQSHKVESHWSYLLAIERDLDELSRYVEFDDKNFGCFSIEIARILLASGAEADVVCKQIYKIIDPQSDKAQSGSLVPFPQLLRPDEQHFADMMYHGYECGIIYRL